MLFSATFPGKLRAGAELWVPDSVTIRCDAVTLTGTLTFSGTPTLSVSYSYYIVSSLLLLYILNAHICPYLIPYTLTAALYSRIL